MAHRTLALATAGVLAIGCLTACGSDTTTPRTPKVGVILPDSTTSNRWEQADRKYLKAAFDASGIASVIENAEGDKARFQRIADDMINGGVTVLMVVNLDSGTGRKVLNSAAAKGVKTIDYDRLTLNGGAQYYVSFDNFTVGRLQGEGLVRCLEAQNPRKAKPVVAELNGSPDDHNATVYKRGYDAVLEARYFTGNQRYVKGPDQPVPDWNNELAAEIFAQMLGQTKNRIDAVLAANDGLADAVIRELAKHRLAGKVPVTGQDATVQGLRHILAGNQCMTVFKDTKKEAAEAAKLALSLARGEPVPAPTTVKDPESGAHVPAFLLQPQAIFRDNLQDVLNAGYVARTELCADDAAALCAAAGIR